MILLPDLSPLTGSQVVRVGLDQQVSLGLAGYGEQGYARVNATLTIDTPFALRRPGGDLTVVPGDALGYPEVALLFGATVVRAGLDEARTLVLDFATLRLAVPPDPRYDAWELDGLGVPGWTMPPHGQAALRDEVRARTLALEVSA